METYEAVTLENRLRELAVKTESVDYLYRSYQAIKEDIKKYLPAIFSYYPHYSAHDASHSQSLISSIELILGERRISALSASDIWLILVSAQLHDVGMIITNEDIAALVKEPDFRSYLNRMRESSDNDFSRAAVLLLDRKITNADDAWFLDIKQSVILLVADYLRGKHAKRSDNIVSGDTLISRILSLKLNGETSRAFTTVGKICAIHGADFDSIFTLYRTDSILNIRCHPRFAAALIRLGDLCDVDNGRFNAALIAVFGRLPQSSLVHYYKHKTITRLCISEREICMSADIPFDSIKKDLARDEGYCAIKGEDFCHKIVYEHQRWFNMIETELQNLMLHAGKIFPTDMDQTMPAFQQEILVNGQRSVFASSNLRLNFAPDKAYALIEGLSLYDEQRTFVREIIQNSLDAMKLQLWRDLNEGRWHAYLPDDKKGNLSALQPFDLRRDIYEYYRVDVSTHTDAETGRKTITFRDNGIGISYENLQNNIIKTGASWNSRPEYENELNSMPPWMRPTGGFGIGLHAAFAVTDRIEIKSKTRYEKQAKHIIIHSGQQDGFVFARDIAEAFPCGTETVIEIDKKLSEIRAKESRITPYDEQPEDEFTFFIEEYMKKVIPCPLFPVSLNGKIVGEALCTCKLYGTIFDSERRDEIDGVFLAATDDVPMRYIVWNPTEGHFYRVLPKEQSYLLNIVCSFKGILLSDRQKIVFYYSNFLRLEALECLSADSKIAISADRKGFLTDYARSVSRKTKNACKPLATFGQKKFSEQMELRIGNLTTENFLALCDRIAQFQDGDTDAISEEKKSLLDQFIKALENEIKTNKPLYLLYLGYAMLRYFTDNINCFLQTHSTLTSVDKELFQQQIMDYLQAQFQFASNIFIYLNDEFGNEFHNVFGRVFGRAFGRAFGSAFGRAFGIKFGRAFGGAFSNAFVSIFGIEFGITFGIEFGIEFCSELGRAFGSEFGRAFGSEFGHEFGNYILTNQWEWIVWIGYCEKLPQAWVDSIYFQSIPAFHFNYYIEDAETVFDIIDKDEFSVLYKNFREMYLKCPIRDNLYVKEINQKNSELYCLLEREDGNHKTISDTSAFSLYCNQLRSDQRSIFCPQKYNKLGMKYHSVLHKYSEEVPFPNNLYIFLPTKIEETDFFDYITENKENGAEAIVHAVLQAKSTLNIIQYTYLHRQDKTVTRAEIEEDYKRFLTEFVTARLEGAESTPSDTVENP